MGREESSGWGTHVYLWQIHFDIWQNQYNIVKLDKIKFKNKQTKINNSKVVFLKMYFIYLFLVALGLLCCMGFL